MAIGQATERRVRQLFGKRTQPLLLIAIGVVRLIGLGFLMFLASRVREQVVLDADVIPACLLLMDR
ncbi:MAG: hypothetical protein KatS3mg016_1884 [Fimbriimonadales bacterium]|nr:MAG: hypothetical protein KatS3mg016_1884 [Fimbriimonadales bacterium]